MASQSSPLSPDKLMYAATFLKGVNEEVGLVFNTFLTAVTVFSAVFQLGSVGVLWLYVLSAGFAVTVTAMTHCRSSQSKPELHSLKRCKQ